MKHLRLLLLLIVAVATTVNVNSQVTVKYNHIGKSRLYNLDTREKIGLGEMDRKSVSLNLPLTPMRDSNRRSHWAVGAYADYITLDNTGEAANLNPSNILNAGVNTTFVYSMSKRWRLMAIVGVGVFTPTERIVADCILANGGVIFIRRMSEHIDLGIGGGVSNSFGIPMVMPMLYFSWHTSGRFKFSASVVDKVQVCLGTEIGKWLSLSLDAVEMDGMTAIEKIEGKNQIYSSVSVGSKFTPTIHLGRHLDIFGSIGGVWVRSIKRTDKTLKAFFNSFKDDSEGTEYRPALHFSAGITYKFK